ncbi:MAG: hypothetical protein LBT80_04665 [Lactobacillaceae bacterium]|jgi:hypothetical protein|nr:hypothetical protein [Lactobacillaceae bacterium]
MKHASKILVGVLSLATLGQVLQATPILADTWTGNGTSGTWGDGDGKTQVSTTISSSYTVTIPASLTLPQSNTYTDESNNVNVVQGAHIPANETIHVNLSGGQTFAATHTSDTVAFKVKLADDTKLSSTTEAYEVLSATASQAHDTGAATDVNVGFDADPDYKFAGIYTGHIQFDVSSQHPVSPVVKNEDGTLQFANHRWRIIVDGDTDANQAGNTRAGDYLAIREDELTNAELGLAGDPTAIGQTAFNNDAYYFSATGVNGYTGSIVKAKIDAYAQTLINTPSLTAGILPVSLNDMSYDDFATDADRIGFSGSGYNAWTAEFAPKDTRGVTTLGGIKQAFALSYGDIHTSVGDWAEASMNQNLCFLEDEPYWLRSPGEKDNFATYENVNFYNRNAFLSDTMAIRPAFWLTTN